MKGHSVIGTFSDETCSDGSDGMFSDETCSDGMFV